MEQKNKKYEFIAFLDWISYIRKGARPCAPTIGYITPFPLGEYLFFLTNHRGTENTPDRGKRGFHESLRLAICERGNLGAGRRKAFSSRCRREKTLIHSFYTL